MMDVPITYIPNFVDNPTETFNTLWNELDWVRVGQTPRREYYCHDTGQDYTYGSGRGVRTYKAQPYHSALLATRRKLEDLTGVAFEVLFLNGYQDARDHLGLHRDFSDSKRPIAIVSLGGERDITFVRNEDVKDKSKHVKVRLQHGSLCLMLPGMQESWRHGILKAGFEVPPRISETFRGDMGAAA